MGNLKIKEVYKSQGKLATSQIVGVYRANEFHNVGYTNASKTTSSECQFSQSGYIDYTYLPVLGGNKEMQLNYFITSVVNDFVKARAHNTSLSSYDSTDVAKWLIASGGLNILTAEIKRAIKSRAIGKNADRQQYLGGLLNCPLRQFNGSLLVDDTGNLIEEFNRIVGKAGSIKVPKGVPFIDYWYKLSSCVYKEDETKKSQNFFLRAMAIPMWDVNATYGNTGDIVYRNLSSSTNNGSPNDIRTMLDLLSELIDTYTTDQIASNMWSEFEKANMSEVYTLSPITREEALDGLEYKCDIDMIQAIKNARIIPFHRSQISRLGMEEYTNGFGANALRYFGFDGSSRVSGFVVPFGGAANSNLVTWIGDYGNTKNIKTDRLLLVHRDDASEDEIFNAMQFSATMDISESSTPSANIELYSAGAAIICGMEIMTGAPEQAVITSGFLDGNYFTGPNATNGTVQALYQNFCIAMRINTSSNVPLVEFTAIPVIYMIAYTTGVTATTRIIVDDCDNVLWKTIGDNENLNNAIVQSLVSYDKR